MLARVALIILRFAWESHAPYFSLVYIGDKMPINQEKLIKLQQQKEKAQIGGKVCYHSEYGGHSSV